MKVDHGRYDLFPEYVSITIKQLFPNINYDQIDVLPIMLCTTLQLQNRFQHDDPRNYNDIDLVSLSSTSS